jgi:hypothetical protein
VCGDLSKARADLDHADTQLGVLRTKVRVAQEKAGNAEARAVKDAAARFGRHVSGRRRHPAWYVLLRRTASGNCYYAIQSSPNTDLGNIITNNNSAGPTLLSVAPGVPQRQSV